MMVFLTRRRCGEAPACRIAGAQNVVDFSGVATDAVSYRVAQRMRQDRQASTCASAVHASTLDDAWFTTPSRSGHGAHSIWRSLGTLRPETLQHSNPRWPACVSGTGAVADLDRAVCGSPIDSADCGRALRKQTSDDQSNCRPRHRVLRAHKHVMQGAGRNCSKPAGRKRQLLAACVSDEGPLRRCSFPGCSRPTRVTTIRR